MLTYYQIYWRATSRKKVWNSCTSYEIVRIPVVTLCNYSATSMRTLESIIFTGLLVKYAYDLALYCCVEVSILLTHWGRVTHICVSNLITIGSVNGSSPGRRQAITWTNAGILLIGPLGTNCSENLSEIHTFSFKKMHLKISSAKWRPFVSASMS